MELDSQTYSGEQRRWRDTFRQEMQTAQNGEWERAVMDNLARAEEQCIKLKQSYLKKEISPRVYREMLQLVADGMSGRHNVMIAKCGNDTQILNSQYKRLSNYIQTELTNKSYTPGMGI